MPIDYETDPSEAEIAFLKAQGRGWRSTRWRQLVDLSDEQLRRLDPIEVNLLVAKGVYGLGDLDIPHYQREADRWAAEVRETLSRYEREFWKNPMEWRNDIRFFRLGALCWYVDQVLGVRYREDHKDPFTVNYADPATVFVHGVIDTRLGTCANMSSVHLGIAWRLRWPLSLACAWSHIFCRYDDGTVTHNLEVSNLSGKGGFGAPPDEYYCRRYGIHPQHIQSGSDLTALRPRQLLGLYIGLRGRNRQDAREYEDAKEDYLLALQLYPQSRFFPTRYEQVKHGRWTYHLV
jgi:hypothetical protein